MKQDRSLWMRGKTECGWLAYADGVVILIQNEYRRWGDAHKSLKNHGCSHCGKPLYDRLTNITRIEKNGDRLREHHLNSGKSIDELRKLRVTQDGVYNLYLLKNGEVVQRYEPEKR